jgi:CheY-like chemotaxis protein
MTEVLVVEDDEAIRGLLRSVLRRDGYAVAEAADGVEGLEKMREHAYDVVLLDLMMPRMNGWEVLDELARDAAEQLACVIVISAALPKKPLHPEHESAVYAVLPKPFELDEVRRTIRQCVEARSRQGS